MLLEFWACLEGEGGVEASMSKASFLCDSVPLRMVHFCPSGAVGGVVPIVPHIQAPSINTSGVHYLADTVLDVGGATGIDLALLGLPGVASKVLHVVVAGVGTLCPTADLSPALKSGVQFLKSGSGWGVWEAGFG